MPSETNASTNSAETATSEEVLIEAMDSFNNDDARLIQRQAKLSSSDSTDSQTTTVNEATQELIDDENIAEDLSTLSEETKISIKLKFINDDQKMVTGNLKELLGDFKR